VGVVASGWAAGMVERIRGSQGLCLAREGKVAARFLNLNTKI
jgi:hypothetical protein